MRDIAEMIDEKIELAKELKTVLVKFVELGAEVTIQSCDKLQTIKETYLGRHYPLEEKSIITITFLYPKIEKEAYHG